MISILFQTESHYLVNRVKIKDAITKTLVGQVKRDAEVSVSIIGDRQMKRLNSQYRNIHSTTDVLSFPLQDSSSPVKTQFVDAPDGILRLGDILVSFPQAVALATEENTLVDDTIVELALHGLNHLLGIHHPE